MNEIKAIETEYAGCLFRSRLEARWAVFFDSLGISWEHEPEGFETSVGNYLPDFRITVGAAPYWFEVKPPGYEYDSRHWGFAVESGQDLVIAEGMSRDYAQQWRVGFLTRMAGGTALPDPVSFRYDNGLRLDPGGSRQELVPNVDRAYRAARSARFGT